jgi:hypothetical protein
LKPPPAWVAILTLLRYVTSCEPSLGYREVRARHKTRTCESWSSQHLPDCALVGYPGLQARPMKTKLDC